MSKTGIRIKKSRSMMFSLYAMSGLTLFLVLSFILDLWFQTLLHLRGQEWAPIVAPLTNSLMVVAIAILLALPLAASLTMLNVIWDTTRWAPRFKKIVQSMEEAPVIIYGAFFLFIFNDFLVGLVLCLGLIACSRLALRWTLLSKKVSLLEMESMQALGLSVTQIIYHLYLKRFFKHYVWHFFAVCLDLFLLVTPVICLVGGRGEGDQLLSTQLLNSVFDDSMGPAPIALILLLFHGLRVLLDQATSYWEVEYG